MTNSQSASMTRLEVLAKDTQTENRWARELREAFGGVARVEVKGARTTSSADAGFAEVVFVDGTDPDCLAENLAAADAYGARVRILLVRDHEGDGNLPAAFLEGRVDDVLVHPFRAVEVMGKLERYQHVLRWDEVMRLNTSYSQLIESLHEDLRLAERLQKSKLPVRYPEIKGFKIHHRYLAGVKAGGDYFDLAETKDGSRFSVLLSDSSSYGLSSAILAAIMKVTVKLSAEEIRSSADVIHRIHEELEMTLSEKDRLSLFYGVISRKDLSLRYVNLGSACAFHASASADFREVPAHAGPLTAAGGMPVFTEQVLTLRPEDRIFVASDGFVESAGGSESLLELLNRFRSKDPHDALNELAFQVKRKLETPDDLPAQDCTGLMLSVDSNVIRLI